jgi:succinate-acetate transporter protein
MEAMTSREPVAGDTARERAAAAPVVTKPITADPGPLGLGAFALTTFMLSMYNAHLVTQAGLTTVIAVALAYGGLAQLLAGMWEFRTGNTFGATAFSSYGAFWISFFALIQFKLIPGTPGSKPYNAAVGLYLIAWGIFTTYMFVASLRTTAAVALVFILLAPTYFLLGIGNANGDANIIKIGGWVGIVTAGAAWYASFAGVVNSTFGRVLMPVIDLKERMGVGKV